METVRRLQNLNKVDLSPVMARLSGEKNAPQCKGCNLHQTRRSSLDVWEYAAGEFDWEADAANSICVIAGSATVQLPDGQKLRLGPGDTVFLPDGLRSHWIVEQQLKIVAATTV